MFIRRKPEKITPCSGFENWTRLLTARSVWSAWSLLSLSNDPKRTKAMASQSHSTRFARFSCSDYGFCELKVMLVRFEEVKYVLAACRTSSTFNAASFEANAVLFAP
jgi:hypothetical protein